MVEQNLNNEEIEECIVSLMTIVKSIDTKERVVDLFGAFVCAVAYDYPDRTKQYLDALGKIVHNK